LEGEHASVGTDRKGPLAAFVVIAVVAAILLVTSVRSQAKPQWFDPGEPSPTVVAAPPISDPLRWVPVAPVGQVVEHGVVLAKKAVSDPTQVQEAAAVVVSTVDTTDDAPVPTTTTSSTPGTTATTRHHRAHHHARHHATYHARNHQIASTAPAPAPAPTEASQALSTPTLQHGRHLGRSHDPAARADRGHGRHLGWRHHRS
jgi:hypothetical protein